MAEEKQKKEVKQIVSGHVKKKSLAEKAGDVFLSEDTRTVGNSILWDVLIPGVKNIVADMIIGGIEMALFGSTRGRRSNSGGGYHVNYNSYSKNDSRYDNRRDSGRRVAYADRDSRYEYNNIILDSRRDAEEVISKMEELVSVYDEATVADLNSLVGITGKFTDNNWGWTDCRAFHVSRSGRGYVLDFEPPVYLD